MNLKARLNDTKPILAPGVFDPLSAKAALTSSRVECLYVSGFSVAASMLGVPDIGLVTMSEMVSRVASIRGVVPDSVAVIADGDNGYGGEHNVARLVNAYESAGVDCIQLEDQVMPKRCGHMENKEIVPREEAAKKIRAAVSSRNSNEFLIMARTDAIATDGLDEALKRAELFLSVGADILFIEAPANVEQMAQIADKFAGTPLVANLVEEGKTPLLEMTDLAEMGYRIVLRPVSALLAVTHALEKVYGDLLEGKEASSPRLTFGEFNGFIGLDDFVLKTFEENQ